METAEFYFKQGYEFYEKGDYELAIESFTKAIEINPLFEDAYGMRGYSHLQLMQYQEAIDDFTKAIEINPLNYTSFYNRGLSYKNLFQYHKSIIDYNKSIEINPSYESAYNGRGNSYNELKLYREAINDFTKAIEINSSYAYAYNGRGNSYYGLKQYQKAINDYNKSIEINPFLSDVYHNRGISYHNLKLFQNAINDFSKAIEVNPTISNFYSGRGMSYFELKQYQLSIEDYSKAIYFNPFNEYAFDGRGCSFHDIKQYQLSIKDFSKAIEINPLHHYSYLNRGISFKNTNQINKSFYDINTYIYLCSIQEVEIQGLNHILDTYENYPQNLQYLLNHFDIDVETLIINPFQSILDKNKDLNLILTCIKRGKWFAEQEMQTLESVFYYYMGGCLSTYTILDEIDISTNQESFYFVLSSKEIQIKFQEDYEWAIKEIKETENEIDNYYLGQLYLLNDNVAQANTYFEKSKTFIFSKIMLAYNTEDKIEKEKLINEINTLDLDTFLEVNLDFVNSYIKDLELEKEKNKKETKEENKKTNPNFNLVFHFFECQEAIINLFTNHRLKTKYYSNTFHSLFKLNAEHKRKLHDLLSDFDILDEIDRIFKELVSELKIDLNLTETERNFKEVKFKKYKNIFKNIKDEIEKGEDAEKELKTEIEAFEINDFKFYVLLIAYAYEKGKIDTKQMFFLILFLIKIEDKHKEKKLDDAVTETINTGLDIGKTVTGNLGLKILFGLAKSGAPKLMEYINLEDKNIKRDTEYYAFKNNILKFFKLEKNNMKEDEFKRKYKLADYFIGIENI
jgi:tetratricopeptide (TPR) repeat protein